MMVERRQFARPRPRLANPHPDCPCESQVIEDEDRRPRRLIIPDPYCPIHGSDT